MTATTHQPGNLVISLDLELLWGVRDFVDRTDYGPVVERGRNTIPIMLEQFAAHDIAATWATVGFAFCESKDELMSFLPDPALRPQFTNPRHSNYAYLDELGTSEADDPHYFGASLIQQIAATPRQEVATHTLSHYFCLEDGHSIESFTADIQAAQRIAETRNITLKSIVFPRNQYSATHIDVCAQLGLSTYRGNQRNWTYHATPGQMPNLGRRVMRLLDAHGPVVGHKFSTLDRSKALVDVSASMYLRPTQNRFSTAYPLHVRALKAGMTTAAKTGESFHLWWHPHDFGTNTDENLTVLFDLLAHYDTLKDRFGMQSKTMADFAIS